MTNTERDPMGPVGVKWNGKSTHQLRTMIQEHRGIAQALQIVQQQLLAAATAKDTAISAELVRLLDRPGVTDPEHVARGYSWECKDSPTGLCIYYTEEDPLMDCCLFCGGPLERK